MLFSQATARTIAPLRQAYKPIDEARDQCEMGVVLGGTPQMLAVAALPAGLMFSTAFYVSLYFTFADCFDSG